MPRSLNVERKRALTDYGARLVALEDDLGFEEARQRAFIVAQERKILFVDLFEGAEIVAAYERIAEILEALGHVPAATYCGLDSRRHSHGHCAGARRSRGRDRASDGAYRIGRFLRVPLARRTCARRQSSGSSIAPCVQRFEAVEDAEAWAMAERLSKETGILAGIASGAVLVAALRDAHKTGDVVAVLPDSGERRFMLADLFR